MKGSYLPPAIRGEMLATENFFYTARFLGLPERATIQELADAGERVCGAEWTRLKEAHLKDPAASEDETFAEDESSLARYCFSASLAVAQLTFGLKLPNVAKIRFSNAVGGKAVDWAMGAAIAFTAGAVDAEEEWLLGPVSGWGGTDGGINAILFGLFDSRVLAVGLVASVGVDRVVAAVAAREDGGAQDPREGTGVGQRGTAAAVGRDLRQPHRLHQESGQGALIFYITKVDGHSSSPGQLSSESFFVRRRFP